MQITVRTRNEETHLITISPIDYAELQTAYAQFTLRPTLFRLELDASALVKNDRGWFVGFYRIRDEVRVCLYTDMPNDITDALGL